MLPPGIPARYVLIFGMKPWAINCTHSLLYHRRHKGLHERSIHIPFFNFCHAARLDGRLLLYTVHRFMSFPYAKRHSAFFEESANRPSMYTRHIVWCEKLPANSSKAPIVYTLILTLEALDDFVFLARVLYETFYHEEIIRNRLSIFLLYLCVCVLLEGRGWHQNFKMYTARSSNRKMMCWKRSRSGVLVAGGGVRSDLQVVE